MAEPITIRKYRLRAGSPIPKNPGNSCPPAAPTEYILQSFGVDVTEVDNWDSVTSLYASEVMQGLQNYEDTDEFREHSYSKISYSGTNYRDTDGNSVFRASEEHTSKWVDEEDSGLVWV